MTPSAPAPDADGWRWPLDLAAYDRTPVLSPDERLEVAYIAARNGVAGGQWSLRARAVLARLVQPIYDVVTLTRPTQREAWSETARTFLLEMHRRDAPFWAWSEDDWHAFIAPTPRAFAARLGMPCPYLYARPRAAIVGYLIGAVPDLGRYGRGLARRQIAVAVFGHVRVDAAVRRVVDAVTAEGYAESTVIAMTALLYDALLVARSPSLEDVDADLVRRLHRAAPSGGARQHVALLAHALATLGLLAPMPELRPPRGPRTPVPETGIAPEWLDWCRRWAEIATVEPRTRRSYYCILRQVGRWLAAEHPDIVSPAQWTPQLATDFVAATLRKTMGQYAGPTRAFLRVRPSKEIKPRTIVGTLVAARRFFRDLQMAELIPLRFTPDTYLAPPRSVTNKIGPDPRVIDKALWAKLVWAGQHLEAGDLLSPQYPLEMVRALAAVWLFTARRSDEIYRLRVGCVEWPATDLTDPETGTVVPREKVCYLHIPTNKTSPPFKIPVAPYVGRMVEAWERTRPHQPAQLDRKDAEMAHYLFSLRGVRVGAQYINHSLIPTLARKATIDPADHRGAVTSHRARATIATLLGNCENPLSLWQMMRWLGHRTEHSTRSYVDVDLTKLAVKIAGNNFLERNAASIPVLVDNDAVVSGAAAAGEPWKYFDLGHGYCTLAEWQSCRYRMACARCDWYLPKT